MQLLRWFLGFRSLYNSSGLTYNVSIWDFSTIIISLISKKGRKTTPIQFEPLFMFVTKTNSLLAILGFSDLIKLHIK